MSSQPQLSSYALVSDLSLTVSNYAGVVWLAHPKTTYHLRLATREVKLKYSLRQHGQLLERGLDDLKQKEERKRVISIDFGAFGQQDASVLLAIDIAGYLKRTAVWIGVQIDASTASFGF
ncbi:hypothetical protein H634G_10593 [Metarhizium anisopliae BRIP 53293]|uniref:Uncharacterized protein n=1 Tax=Metarhizium anisopliae BRIP 53293 TaxID=1291518 RepID=A0A0D9NJD7_METAN|nr:hypothetical protein H634G_10593 [Metarhizium anisopliae BRIP 53293]